MPTLPCDHGGVEAPSQTPGYPGAAEASGPAASTAGGDRSASAESAFTQGEQREEAGDPAGAITAFQRALESGDPEYAPRAALRLGGISWEKGDLAGAATLFQRAIDSGHADATPKGLVNLGRLLAKQGDQGDLAGAATLLQRAIDSGHADATPRALASLGQLLTDQGDLAGAATLLQRAIDSGHADATPHALNNLGILQTRRGDLAGAATLLQRAIDSGHADVVPGAAYGLGELKDKQGDLTGAAAAYQIAIDSGDPVWAQKAQGKLKRLKRTWFPSNWNWKTLLWTILRRNGLLIFVLLLLNNAFGVKISDTVLVMCLAIMTAVSIAVPFASRYWRFKRTHTREGRAALAAKRKIKFAERTTFYKREALRTGAECVMDQDDPEKRIADLERQVAAPGTAREAPEDARARENFKGGRREALKRVKYEAGVTPAQMGRTKLVVRRTMLMLPVLGIAVFIAGLVLHHTTPWIWIGGLALFFLGFVPIVAWKVTDDRKVEKVRWQEGTVTFRRVEPGRYGGGYSQHPVSADWRENFCFHDCEVELNPTGRITWVHEAGAYQDKPPATRGIIVGATIRCLIDRTELIAFYAFPRAVPDAPLPDPGWGLLDDGENVLVFLEGKS
jgi:tetratricopeptide (TPR) repeat protein